MFVAYINLALLFALCMAIADFLLEAIKVRRLNKELTRLRIEYFAKQYQLQPKRGRGRPRKNTITF